MDSRTAKLINCLLKRVKKLELNSNNNSNNNTNNNSIFDLKDFTTKNFDENEIDDAFDQLRVYFKGQNLLVCLIGIDETLLSDDTFRHTLSNNSLGNGNLKHYSSDTSVINNYFNELDDNMKPFVNLINGLEIELTVGDTKMIHIVGSLSLLDAAFLKENGFGVDIKVIDSLITAYGNPLGTGSTAMGYNTFASGAYSTAMGYQTYATGDYCTAMGYQTYATGEYSTAMGYQTNDNGVDYCTAMGYQSYAEGEYSTAMGYQTDATGVNSTDMGYQTEASGVNSTAMGASTQATGEASTAMGHGAYATGAASTAMGRNTTAPDYGSLVIGQYTINTGNTVTTNGSATSFNSNNTAFVIGSGNYELNELYREAFKVLFNGAVRINDSYTLPTKIGNEGQVLTYKNGAVIWADI